MRCVVAVSFCVLFLMGCFGPPVQPQQEDKETYLSPDSVAKIGDFSISLIEGIRGKIMMRDEIRKKEMKSEKPYTAILIRIANTSTTKLGNYRQWTGREGLLKKNARLSDNFKNHYKQIDTGYSLVFVGQQKEITRIDPGQEITELLVFEKLLDNATDVILELPSENFMASAPPNPKFKLPIGWFKNAD